MTRRVLILIAAIACATLASIAGAATGNKPAPPTKKKPAVAATSAAAPAATRTLDAIRIEGEIDVPQVLFITARDYRRFRDATPAPYRITSAAVGKSIPLPDRLRLVAPVK